MKHKLVKILKMLVSFGLLTFLFLSPVLAETNFVKFFPRVVSANNDGVNDRLFLNYTNDEGKNLVLKIYDIKGILVFEKKIANSEEEKSNADGSYSFSVDITNFKDLFSSGVYICVVGDGEKVLSKGSFVVAR
jgi:hypothetical protein